MLARNRLELVIGDETHFESQTGDQEVLSLQVRAKLAPPSSQKALNTCLARWVVSWQCAQGGRGPPPSESQIKNRWLSFGN